MVIAFTKEPSKNITPSRSQETQLFHFHIVVSLRFIVPVPVPRSVVEYNVPVSWMEEKWKVCVVRGLLMYKLWGNNRWNIQSIMSISTTQILSLLL